MSSQQSLVLLSLVALFASSSGLINNMNNLNNMNSMNNPQYYCGRSLAKALALLCYDDIFTEKRSGSSSMYGAVLTPYYKEAETQGFGLPFVSQYKARSLSQNRGKRFVVNECCDKACSIEELLSYC